jgi:filamentous hemagglutinin family protein
VAITWVVSYWTTPAFAQVIPDSTLGGEQSVVTPDVIIRGLPADQIDGGAIRGANLFHSFSEFNVGEGQRVYFANPTGIDTILSRVTGTDVSDILGTLGVNGGANLFLINPNGIVFGKNAQLDVQGAFVASTAEEWVFEHGTEFSATNPQAPPLLTINLTPGLQYGSNYQGAIASSGGLAVGGDLILAGRTLDLSNQVQAGGNLTLFATDTLKVRDSVASPFIASAMGQLLVQGNQRVDVFALNHPDSGLFSGGDMVLRSGNTVSADAHFWSGGNFRIEQLDSNLGDLSSPYDPVIRASGDVSFNDYTGPSLHILAGGSVTISGNVAIEGVEANADAINGDIIRLSDGTEITINGSIRPTLDIRAGTTDFGTPDAAPIDNFNPFGDFDSAPTIDALGTGTSADIRIAGFIDIQAADGLVLLTNQYRPNLSLSGGVITVPGIFTDDFERRFVGNSGSVFIDARGNIEMGQIDTSSFSGNGGEIRIISDQNITFTDTVDSSVRPDFGLGFGVGGNITVTAQESIVLPSANISIISATQGQGKGGDIEINTRSLSLVNGAGIFTVTQREGEDSGQGGNLTINASESVELIGVGIPPGSNQPRNTSLQARTLGDGNAGNLTVNTRQLILRDGGILSTTNCGTGAVTPCGSAKPGTLRVNASDFIELIGTPNVDNEQLLTSGLFSTSVLDGDGGDVFVETRQLIIRDGAQIAAAAEKTSSGAGGNITVTASDLVELSGTRPNGIPGGLYTFAAEESSGDAGNLTVNTGRFIVRDGASVASSTDSTGNAGDLAINASESMEVINAEVRATTTLPADDAGDAGNFLINTNQLIVRNSGLVSASTSGSGNAGELTIDTERLVLQGGGQISAITFDSGQGGIIEVNASESVDVNGSGSGLFFESRSLANARGITLNTGRLTVENGGQLTVSGSGSGTSGDLEITADSIFLTNQGRLRATTTASEGGNIRLDVTDSIIMRFNSEIAAEAFGTANGGNITINAGGIVLAILSENSDVVANAFAGQGGTISATALLIEGFRQFEDSRTPESDFTASSELGIDGTVDINTETRPQLEPLPQLQPVDPIEPRCQLGQRRGSSEFIISGRGGLPPNPINNGGYNQGWVDFRDPISSTENRVNSGGNNPQTERKATQIIEAQGWIIKENGEVELVAEVPNPTLYSSWQTPICPVPNDAIVP